MIPIKSDQEIQIMIRGGRILADILADLLVAVKPGITGLQLENIACDLIKKNNGIPSFQTVRGYKYATCISINDVVVHGIPTNTPFQDGDIVGIDIGMLLDGFHTDMSWTVPVGFVSPQTVLFLETGKKALQESINKAVSGNRIGHISQVIEQTVTSKGYSVVRSLIGHGVGKNLHEDPEIPGFMAKPIEKTPLLEKNNTLAIEIIYNQGAYGVVYKNDDGWTISTRDESLSGLFELTVAVGEKKPCVLTSSEKFAKITGLNANA